MTEPMKLLKTDGRGRVRTPAARREALLREYEQSGTSAAAFAKLCGVKYPTFERWVQQRRREPESGERVPTVPLVEVSVSVEPDREVRPTAPVVLELPGGAQVVVREAAQLSLVVALVQALAGGPAGGRRC